MSSWPPSVPLPCSGFATAPSSRYGLHPFFLPSRNGVPEKPGSDAGRESPAAHSQGAYLRLARQDRSATKHEGEAARDQVA